MYKLNLIPVIFALLLMPHIAFAQVWLPQRSSTEGAGIKLGESLVLHPGIGFEIGFDTNPLRSNSNDPKSGRIRLTPYVDIGSKSGKRIEEDKTDVTPQRVYFRLGLAAYYDAYISKNEFVDRQDNIGIITNMNLIVFPKGPFSLLIDADYTRSRQPYDAWYVERWSWHLINAGLGLRVRPGGGTLTIESGYKLTLLLYDDPELADAFDKQVHDIRFITSWRMFPKTALITKINLSPTIYMFAPASQNEFSHFVLSQNYNSTPIRMLTGIEGLFTPKFGLSLFGGYGASFYYVGNNFEGFIGKGELMFFATPTSNIKFGAQRDFVDSFYSNYYTKAGGYLKYDQMLGGMTLVSLKGDINKRKYSDLALPQYQLVENREEVWVNLFAMLEVRVTDWLSFLGSIVYEANLTDYKTPVPTRDPDDDPDAVDFFPIEFRRFELMVGAKVHY